MARELLQEWNQAVRIDVFGKDEHRRSQTSPVSEASFDELVKVPGCHHFHSARLHRQRHVLLRPYLQTANHGLPSVVFASSPEPPWRYSADHQASMSQLVNRLRKNPKAARQLKNLKKH